MNMPGKQLPHTRKTIVLTDSSLPNITFMLLRPAAVTMHGDISGEFS
ncbi:hypothetical protein DLM_0532 [Aquitalea magnusonii]|uniref:Uncharacterized protein n=1 Tax=Aquitalea magnusonii TaxID=332411 RepID=A0A3G9GBL0_9NEIS|nr:hypothetical protein DLM_0532 [Aquitalea magnusonii]